MKKKNTPVHLYILMLQQPLNHIGIAGTNSLLAAASTEFGYFVPTTIIFFLLQNTYSLKISFFCQFKFPVK